jgi:hypothetical protein
MRDAPIVLRILNSRFSSLEEIGKFCGLTRAAVSQNLVKFRDEVGLAFAMGGKSEGSRDKYSRAQKAATIRKRFKVFAKISRVIRNVLVRGRWKLQPPTKQLFTD